MAEHGSGARSSSNGANGGTGDPRNPPVPRPAIAVPDKQTLRTRLLAARRALTAPQRAQAAEDLRSHVLEWAQDRPDGPVCAYLPVGAEPGSLDLLDGLRATGRSVLLPVVPPRPGALDWAPYRGADSLGPGPLGLREPTTPRLGPAALRTAVAVLVPALAADRAGHRLGRGGGYYDRTLGGSAPGTALLALLYDGELLDAVPADAHDHPVTGVAMPTAGIVVTGNIGRA
ncbi:5-formyltetrahydrofolate cyclo-ligase [Pseudonocardia sp. WMMC193]|uniref:5-formyltetrahydrofolate cyclo-ligase n=1 Tax=Pseudonocardia sp. WMMC193 TaxID=2911965 RepID=UPI001F02CBBD|nr:5-formyltetrahydrofolate cyclo-ligase [Pseudonocardia sp. WMMC193]MCF7551318.1 5-formyltetrahydrofolate cyclo-ligase [Pseudonocardia sp. WMMC193]